MKDKGQQKMFVIFGIIFFIYSAILSIATISTKGFPNGADVIQLALSIMCFCLAYLSPQFKRNDERVKMIKAKGMFVSYFFIMGYIIILMILFQFDIVLLSAYQALSILAALIIITVFISFVVLSKRY